MKKLFFLLAILILTIPIYAQEKDHEVNSEIKELSEFHDVIYPIWHSAWPEKNIEMLKSSLEDVQKGYDKIAKAELPGILRDKKAKWNEELNKFTVFVNDYKTAVAKNDSVGLLNAAEKLHAQYEALVRVVKPKLKEVDAFHQVLYNLYHYYTPEGQYEKIKEAVAQLKIKAAGIPQAKLSVKQKAREEAFKKLTAELIAEVDKLDSVVKAGDDKKNIQDTVESMHSKYEELEKVFD